MAHQLLINGRIKRKPQPKHKYKKTEKQHEIEESILIDPFSRPELQTTIDELKNRKAASVDDICTEKIKHFGPIAKKWLLDLFNNITNNEQIPKI